jgi:tetratricopeptide (TPR) repeat protein
MMNHARFGSLALALVLSAAPFALSFAADGPMMIPVDPPGQADKDKAAPPGAANPGATPTPQENATPGDKTAPDDKTVTDDKTDDATIERRKKAEKEGGYRPFTPEAFRSDKKGDPGMMGLPWPKTPDEASKTVESLLAALATTDDHSLARQVAVSIERIWRIGAGDTVNLLMERAEGFTTKNENDKALNLLDAAVDLAPDYAEAWNRHAFANYRLGHNEAALGDLRRTLALEPNHFRALEGMAKILTEVGEKKGALKAYEQLLKIYPGIEGGQSAAADLKKAVEGQGI